MEKDSIVNYCGCYSVDRSRTYKLWGGLIYVIMGVHEAGDFDCIDEEEPVAHWKVLTVARKRKGERKEKRNGNKENS